MATFEQTKAGYGNLWDRAKVRPDKVDDCQRVIARMQEPAHLAEFKAVEAATGVPWFMVGLILWRESDLNLGTYLGNGQSIHQRTTIVPIGRGPFASFHEGAIDAIHLEGFQGIAAEDWTIERILYWLERLNGQGYFTHGNSPYLWSWTDQYTAGKFVRDHVYDPNFVDPQGGCAAVLKVMESQGIVKFNREGTAVPTQPKVKPVTTPTATMPVDQIESLVENVLERFGGIVVKFIPAGPGKDMLNLVIDRLPDIELELKLESVREHIKDPAALAVALGQVARNWADKVNPPGTGPA